MDAQNLDEMLAVILYYTEQHFADVVVGNGVVVVAAALFGVAVDFHTSVVADNIVDRELTDDFGTTVHCGQPPLPIRCIALDHWNRQLPPCMAFLQPPPLLALLLYLSHADDSLVGTWPQSFVLKLAWTSHSRLPDHSDRQQMAALWPAPQSLRLAAPAAMLLDPSFELILLVQSSG
jgi:hypothetical protein